MLNDEIYELARRKQPRILCLTGKTSTGKSTLSDRLAAACKYEVVKLDKIVGDTIVDPFGLQSSRGDVFVSVYKTADRTDWIKLFTLETQKRIRTLLGQGKKVIIDGAIANPVVVRSIFDGLPDVLLVYMHPTLTSAAYRRNLTNRFLGTTAQNPNSLPKAFWEHIDQDCFQQFCQNRIMSAPLEKGIDQYAAHSSQESAKRLQILQEYFPDIIVVNV